MLIVDFVFVYNTHFFIHTFCFLKSLKTMLTMSDEMTARLISYFFLNKILHRLRSTLKSFDSINYHPLKVSVRRSLLRLSFHFRFIHFSLAIFVFFFFHFFGITFLLIMQLVRDIWACFLSHFVYLSKQKYLIAQARHKEKNERKGIATDETK